MAQAFSVQALCATRGTQLQGNGFFKLTPTRVSQTKGVLCQLCWEKLVLLLSLMLCHIWNETTIHLEEAHFAAHMRYG